MKKILHIILLFALLGNFSCKKERKETEVGGFICDFVTLKPLAGVDVYLQEYDFDPTSLNPVNIQTMQSTTTGSDGKFKFDNFHALKTKHYGLEYQKLSECYHGLGAPTGIAIGKPNTFFLKLHSNPFLYIHVKNTSPYDVNDHICYYLTN
jgi:hypothetical protein